MHQIISYPNVPRDHNLFTAKPLLQLIIVLNGVFLCHAFYLSLHLSFLSRPLPELPNQCEHSMNSVTCFDSSLPMLRPLLLWDLMLAHLLIFPLPISFQPPFQLFTSLSSFDSSSFHWLTANLFTYCCPCYYCHLLSYLYQFQDHQATHPAQHLLQLSVAFQTSSSPAL